MKAFPQPNQTSPVLNLNHYQKNVAQQIGYPASLFQHFNPYPINHNINPNFLKSVLNSLNKSDGDATANTKTKNKKEYKKFSIFEDMQLKMIVNRLGPKNWTDISSLMPNKTAKQCRDRYMNYLAPGIVHAKWTREEDIFLAQKFREFGPCWSKIQKFFPYRTSNSIKNRYLYTVSKKINKKPPSSDSSNTKTGENEEPNFEIFNQNQSIAEIQDFDFQNLEEDENEFDLFFDDF